MPAITEYRYLAVFRDLSQRPKGSPLRTAAFLTKEGARNFVEINAGSADGYCDDFVIDLDELDRQSAKDAYASE